MAKSDPAPKKPKMTKAEAKAAASARMTTRNRTPGLNPNELSAKARASRLRQIIEPNTEAMVQVMMDIALDTAHLKDKNKPSIHPSIRLEAADRVLNRAYGKPKETLGIEDESAQGVESDEVLKLLNGILDKVGAPAIEGPSSSGDGSGS
jgi:hypothetical protein